MYLLLKSDEPEVYIGIWQDNKELATKKWEAGRELSSQIHEVINNLCEQADTSVKDFSGIIVYKGPGSYTGIRISVSVANSIGYSYDIPVIGTSGVSWIQDGLIELKKIDKFSVVSPVYGGEVYTTKPKK